MKLKPYPVYKDSGVPWLGEVPEHWGVRRLKRLCSRSALYGANVAATAYSSTGVRFLRTTDITEDGQLKAGGVFLPEELVHDYMLTDGDVLISRSGTIGRSFLYDSKLHGRCAYAGYLVRFVPASDVLPRYVFFYTKTHAFAGFLRVMAISSTIENVNGEKYANAAVPLPPLPEQANIVRFLDYADRRIRRYIRAKQTLIKLLEEQKQAIIHRAVTRGLDPNVRLKPSGVEWLGDVPEHWEAKRLRHISPRIGVGLVINPSTYFIDEATPDGVPILLGNNIVPGGFKVDHVRRISKASNQQLGASRLNRGDVVVVRVGAPGVAAVVPPGLDQCNCASVVIVRRASSFVSEWLAHAFNSSTIQAQIDVVKYGAAQKQFNVSHAVDFWFAVPPIEEQGRIVEHLHEAISVPDNATNNALREIHLLREYRTRLIADVVTGKLDVREAAARLPDEAEEPELIDEAEALSAADEETADDLDAASEENE